MDLNKDFDLVYSILYIDVLLLYLLWIKSRIKKNCFSSKVLYLRWKIGEYCSWSILLAILARPESASIPTTTLLLFVIVGFVFTTVSLPYPIYLPFSFIVDTLELSFDNGIEYRYLFKDCELFVERLFDFGDIWVYVGDTLIIVSNYLIY